MTAILFSRFHVSVAKFLALCISWSFRFVNQQSRIRCQSERTQNESNVMTHKIDVALSVLPLSFPLTRNFYTVSWLLRTSYVFAFTYYVNCLLSYFVCVCRCVCRMVCSESWMCSRIQIRKPDNCFVYCCFVPSNLLSWNWSANCRNSITYERKSKNHTEFLFI